MKSSVTPKTVAKVNVNNYMGKWYEIARLPQFFQRNCASDVTANYTQRQDGKITVTNRCVEKNGKATVAKGVAKVDERYAQANNSKLLVNFLPNWLQWLPVGNGSYWILALDKDDKGNYTHSLVGSPNKKYLWLLSRTPDVSDADFSRLMAVAKAEGYNLSKLIKTPHNTHVTPPTKVNQ